MMKPLLSAWLYEHDNGDVEWTIRSHPRAEALGLTPVIAGGRVRGPDVVGGSSSDVEDISIAIDTLGARLVRLADSAAWSHPLF
jgi:hypothetical protein